MGKKALEFTDVVETLLPYEEGDVLELDKLWSFVHKKSNKCWVWIALCNRTKQVVSWAIGSRDQENARLSGT